MKLLKEYAVGIKSSPGQSVSCAFETKEVCYTMMSGSTRAYGSERGSPRILELPRPYCKILKGDAGIFFYGFQIVSQKGEIVVYFLDEECRETDCFSVAQNGTGRLTDMWIDHSGGFLFLVYSTVVERFNLNGDGLGTYMKSALYTKYLAMCTWMDRIYLALERRGSVYLAEYGWDGSFLGQFSLGNVYQIKNMDVKVQEDGAKILIFAAKPGGIFVCLQVDTELEMELSPRKTDAYSIEEWTSSDSAVHDSLPQCRQCRRKNNVCYYQ